MSACEQMPSVERRGEGRGGLVTCNDGVRGGDRGDDVLHHALGQRPGDAFDLELLCARQCGLVQPANVLRVVCIKFLVCLLSEYLTAPWLERRRTSKDTWPFQYRRPLYAMLR